MDQCSEIRADCEARFEALEAWQLRQNGSLQRIDERLDRMFWTLLGTLGTLIVSLVLLVLNLMEGHL